MAATKVEMSLDEIIKSSKKNKPRNPKAGQKKGNKVGPKKNMIKKKQNTQAKEGPRVTAATKKLVQKLVAQELAKKGVSQPRVSPRKNIVLKKVNVNSRVIRKRRPQTETVVVRRIQRPVVRKPQIVREIVVNEPVRKVVRPVQRRIIRQVQQQPRQKVVYVQKASIPRRFQRVNRDPFYEPPNYLQRI